MLSLKVTLFVLAVMGWQQRAKAFSGSFYSSVIKMSKLFHVVFIDHTDYGLRLVDMDLRVLQHVLVASLDHSETIITNELLCDLFGLAMVGA